LNSGVTQGTGENGDVGSFVLGDLGESDRTEAE
jgi:hypothetical protein